MSRAIKLLSLIILIFAGINTVSGQANLLNARVPQEVGNLNDQQIEANDEAPLAYGFVDDRDVMWSKTVWEVIDLDERVNFPYYYPTDTLNLGPERRSLFDVLKKILVIAISKRFINPLIFRKNLLMRKFRKDSWPLTLPMQVMNNSMLMALLTLNLLSEENNCCRN